MSSKIVSLVLWVVALTAAPAWAELKPVDWPRKVIDAAISRDGSVAVIHDDQLTIYPRLSAENTFAGDMSLQVGVDPVAIVHKRLAGKGYFIALCRGDSKLYVVDEQTGKLVKDIPLSGRFCRGLAAAWDEQTPWLYYVAASRVGNGSGVGRVDLAAMKDEGELLTDRFDGRRIACSPDGRMIYVSRNDVPHNGKLCFELLPQRSTDGILKTRTRSADPQNWEQLTFFVVDPLSRFVSADRGLLSPALTPTMPVMPGRVVGVMTTRPVLFIRDDRGLQAYSANTWRRLKTAVIPALGDPDPVKAVGEPSLVRLLIDEKNDRLLQWTPTRVAMLKVEDLKIPAEPVMDVQTAGVTELQVGQPWTMKLTPRSPGLTMSLDSPPEGMTLKGNQLSWTPAVDLGGPVTVSLKLTAGEVSRTQEIVLRVRRTSLQLSFSPRLIAISPDDSLALVARHESLSNEPPQLAVVDLKQSKVLAEQPFPETISAIAIDAVSAYVASSETRKLHVLDLKDMKERAAIPLKGKVTRILHVGDRLALLADAAGPPAFYFKSEGKTYDLVPAGMSNAKGSMFYPCGGGTWYHYGRVMKADLDTTLLLDQFDNIPLLADVPARPLKGVESAVQPWGVIIEGGQLFRVSGEKVPMPTDAGYLNQVLDEYPAAMFVKFTSTGRFDEPVKTESVDLNFADLVTGKVLRTIVVDRVLARQRAFNDQPRARAGAHHVVVVDVDHLYVLPLDLKGFPTPLQIAPIQLTFGVGTDAPSTLKYSVVGGTTPYKFSLMNAMPGLSINSDTGDVTIDPKDLLPATAARVVEQTRKREIHLVGVARGTMNPEQYAREVGEDSITRFTQMTEFKPKGQLFMLPIGITVMDSQQQATRLTHLVGVDMPTPSLDDWLAKELPRKREQLRREGVLEPPTWPEQDRQRRIDQLQKENADLEAKIKRLREKPATQP